MDEEAILKDLAQLQKSATRSKTARLRDLYDQIEALRSRGITHAKIVSVLNDHKLGFSLKSFEVTFYRIKRQREKKLNRPVAIPAEEKREAMPSVSGANDFFKIVDKLKEQNQNDDPRRND
ncbi:MAG TPA: hypothetical protein VFF81_14790 [Noviherbaspirillum sp.]|nr:hypothetical protein [Noviherbaspirillum sp.]